jgi:hypothetical protein
MNMQRPRAYDRAIIEAVDAERIDELAQLLCAGLKRILTEQSSPLSASTRDSSVDFSPLKSGIARRKLRNRTGG